MLLWQLNLDLVNLSDLFLSALLLPRGPEALHFQRDVLDKDRETAGIHFLGILKLDCQMTQCTAHSLVLSQGRSYCQCQWCPVHSRNSEYSGEQDKNQAVLLVYLMHFTQSFHMSDGLKTVYMQWHVSPVFPLLSIQIHKSSICTNSCCQQNNTIQQMAHHPLKGFQMWL